MSRNRAANTGIAKSLPGHGTPSPSPIQNTPNAESMTPTLIVQCNGSRGTQTRLAQPTHAEQKWEDANTELQQAQRNLIQE